MDQVVIRTVSFLIVAVLVGLLARRIRLPYTVGLVVAGGALALGRLGGGAALTHETIYFVILPPLLYEAAINIRWRDLSRDLVPVLTLAFIGTIIAAAVVSLGLIAILHWPGPAALIFGLLIAATDPVSVIAMFKETPVVPRLRLLVESESLLNDGVAAVFFGVAVILAQQIHGAPIPFLLFARNLGITMVGGIAVGLAGGAVAMLIAGRTTDHLLETALTVAAAYGSFIWAEHWHVSGVLATVVAGLLMGNLGIPKESESQPIISERGREFVLDFWEFVAFLANSFVFLLIGLRLTGVSFALLGIKGFTVVVLLVLLGRAVAVYPLSGLFRWSRWKIELGHQHIMWWGGLRGALGLALVLTLPESLPFRNILVVATFAMVAFSILVQGLTMPAVVKQILPLRTSLRELREGRART